MRRFIGRHSEKIAGVLACFDRVIFKGYLPLSYPGGFEGFLSYHRILFKDYAQFVTKQAARIKEHALQLAKMENRPYEYFNHDVRKEEAARAIAKRDGITEGLVCIFSAVEACNSFVLRYGEGRPRFATAQRKCLCLYFYFIDRVFGLMHIRIQTWFPFTVQVYINGHEWLARKMDRHGINYRKVENAFVEISDFRRAQKFANKMVKQNWPRILEVMARKVNPLIGDLLNGMKHYWVTEQAEYSTDIIFKDGADLNHLYKKLLNHAITCFGAEDVLTFLERKLTGNFLGEVHGQYKGRNAGARVRHRMKRNWVKMYNKHGRVLRIETVINDPREFRVRRWGTRKGERVLEWFPMCKGVKNLYRYAQVSYSANKRYADALAVVDDPKPAFESLQKVARPVENHGRSVRGFNVIAEEDLLLFSILLLGEHLLHGFRNKDIRNRFYKQNPADPQEKKRQSASISRLLKRLHLHRMIAKIPKSRRWRVTQFGHIVMSTAIKVREEYFPRCHTKIACAS